jgi:hypothetical protein
MSQTSEDHKVLVQKEWNQNVITLNATLEENPSN